ncbi:MAG: hypothetical protein Q9162_001857 [Coniocarpon cinnabarinum]
MTWLSLAIVLSHLFLQLVSAAPVLSSSGSNPLFDFNVTNPNVTSTNVTCSNVTCSNVTSFNVKRSEAGGNLFRRLVSAAPVLSSRSNLLFDFNVTNPNVTSSNGTNSNGTSSNGTSSNGTSFNVKRSEAGGNLFRRLVSAALGQSSSRSNPLFDFNVTNPNVTSSNGTSSNGTNSRLDKRNFISLDDSSFNDTSFDDSSFNDASFDDTSSNDASFDDTSSNVTSVHVKRSEAGPKLGGMNFPDPTVFHEGNTWYAFATDGNGKRVQMASSTDFNTWTYIDRDAMPTVGGWVNAASAQVWAPSVVKVDDGSFVMYYSAATKQDNRKHCVGAASSSTITGPYTPQPNALYCPLDRGGAIDASWFVDTGGQRYVLYKIDGNSIGHGGSCGNSVNPIVPTPILMQAVAGDGVTPQGDPVQLFDNAGASDDGIVEAPSLVKAPDGTYVLFFSSGCYRTPDYTVNYATSNAVFGPYTRAAAPLFKTGTDGLSAPGGMTIWNDAVHMVFHAGPADDRAMYTAQVTVNGATVTA